MRSKILLSVFLFLSYRSLSAQDSTKSCKVVIASLTGKYTGKCKKGYADGKGEAVGLQHYTGDFKEGSPNGKGIYYYTDSIFHDGTFQDGLKEGKGEMHYLRAGLPDSVIKGYWSGDVFRGKRYITNKFQTSMVFDSYEVTHSPETGNSVTVECSTTSTAQLSSQPGPLVVLGLRELTSMNGDFLRKDLSYSTASKTSVTYILNKFPAKLFGTFTNGQTFELELYKPAKWIVKLYLNK